MTRRRNAPALPALLLSFVLACASTDNATDVATQDAPPDVAGDLAPDPVPEAAAEAGDPGAEAVVVAPFQIPDPATTFTYRVANGSGTLDLPAAAGPVETYHGKEYRRLDLGDFTKADPTGVKAWANFADPQIEFGGAQVFVAGSGTPGQPSIEYVLDAPITGRLDGQVGKTLDATATGHLVIGGSSQLIQVHVEYTLASANETVEVPYGSVKGCLHYHLVVSAGDLQGWAADYWLKSGIGLIKATSIPGFDEVDLLGVKAL